MAKRSSDPRVVYPEVKVHVRDLVRVLGVVAPFAPRVSIRENLFYRAPGTKWAQETCAGCPQQRYATGEPGKVQGWDRVGIVEWSYENRARGVSIWGKFVLFTKLGYKTRGCHHVAKRSSDSRVAYPEVKVQVRDLVRVVGIVAPFAPRGVSIRGKFVVSDIKWAQETCAGCPEQMYATGGPGKVQGRYRVGIVERSCGYRTRRVSVWGKFVLSKSPGHKTRGVAMWLNVVLTPG